MFPKFEAMMAAPTITFERACAKLQHENQEFHRQLKDDMQTFQMNMFPTVVTTCPQNTINSVTNYQAASQEALQAQAQFSIELRMEPQTLADSPNLNALDTAPSRLDIPPTSTAQESDDPKLATKPYSCTLTRYPYSTMSTRSISINTPPCASTRKKIMSHLAFNVSLSNFSYVDPPLPQPHCLNLPPGRAKKKGVYS